MQFDDVILGRRSIRGYKPGRIPRALIEEIIGLAMRAPSSMNTQPWKIYSITSEPLDKIRAGRRAAGRREYKPPVDAAGERARLMTADAAAVT